MNLQYDCTLLTAVEEGDISVLKDLLAQETTNIDATNKRGDSALHIAARLGNQLALELLRDHGCNLDVINSLGDTPAIITARHGDLMSLRILTEAGADLSIRNKEGETCLHAASGFGDVEMVRFICSQPNINLDQQDQDGESSLHIACSRGYLSCVKCLVDLGATLDLPNSDCATPLHVALTARQAHIATFLLHAGADSDVQDWGGDAPIHLAAREGLLLAVQILCSFGCNVDAPNKQGLCPLHLAALHGHTEVVRCLCLAGCSTDVRNSDGIKAEITALKHGHNAISDLLNRLRNTVLREQYTAQLAPTTRTISRVNLKLLGHSGVGKTTLAQSLQSGYFTSLLRRSKANLPTTNNILKGITTSPNKTQIEMDITSRNNSISFDTYSYQYTHGIDVKQVSLPGVGELTLWDFSGQDTYFLLHHLFLGCSRSIHAVVVSLRDTPIVQLQQACFWLSFLQARLRPNQNIGYCGRVSNPIQVVVIATHPDIARLPRDSNGEYVDSENRQLISQLQQRFHSYFQIHSEVFTLDARAPGSNVLRYLRQRLGELKQNVIHGILKWSGFSEAVLSWLPSAVRQLEHFPVMMWDTFLRSVRSNVNPLASEEHVKELCTQLQVMGEIIVVHGQPQDIVVMSPRWLCHNILGQLLSIDFLTLARVTGCYTVDDFQAAFSECDASQLLILLEQLQLCTQCENDGESEYEFPCYNMVETLEGLWDKLDPRYQGEACYVGLRLKTPPGTTHLLHAVFPRIQVQLRRATKQYCDPECDLYQWFHGSKLCAGLLESLITLELDDACGEAIEIKVRGPPETGLACFYFMEELLGIVHVVMTEMCPNLVLERHTLSARQLQMHCPTYCFPPSQLAAAILDHELAAVLHNPWLAVCCDASSPIGNKCVVCPDAPDETVLDLIGCSSSEVADVIIFWPKLSVCELSMSCRRALSALLDPPEPLGKDWCLLAVQLGLANSVAHLEAAVHPSHPAQVPILSQTDALLDRWLQADESQATLGALVQALKSLGRDDAADLILRSVPLYQVIDSDEEEEDDDVSAYIESLEKLPTDGARNNLSR